MTGNMKLRRSLENLSFLISALLMMDLIKKFLRM